MTSVLVYLRATYHTNAGVIRAQQAFYMDADKLDACQEQHRPYELYGTKIPLSDIMEIGRPG